VNLKIRKSKFKSCVLFLMVLAVGVCLTGCEAFVRKFTRKPKKEKLPVEEMVVSPVEYKVPEIPAAQLYQQYFSYWKAGHDELIDSLSSTVSRKRQLGFIDEAIKNLEQAAALLKEDNSRIAAGYVEELGKLKKSIETDLYGANLESQRRSAELLEREILRKLSYSKIKDYLL